MRIIIAIIGITGLISCGTTKETGGDLPSATRLKSYEETFNPTEYNEPLKDFFTDTNPAGLKDSTKSSSSDMPEPQELTQGYRVQIFATTNYDEATTMKSSVEDEFQEEWFYLVYDAPTYKLRAGNFLERYEADRFAKLVGEKGYKNAWVVPERVLKNPSPRFAPLQDTQK